MHCCSSPACGWTLPKLLLAFEHPDRWRKGGRECAPLHEVLNNQFPIIIIWMFDYRSD